MEKISICLNSRKWKNKLIFNLIIVTFFTTPFTKAQENIPNNKTDTLNYYWERFSFNLGGFITGLNSDIQLGSQEVGIGAAINIEDALGLETSTLVLRSEMEYNYGRRRRHTARLGYFSLFRNARKVLDSEIEIGDETFPVGTEVSSKFDLQIYKGAYDYSFYMDERVKLGITFGLFIMPISFSTSALGLSEEVAEFIAPLPVFGLRTNFAISPKLFLKQSIEILYLEISNFKGSISDINLRLEYNPWKHFGFGLGINSYRLNISIYENDNTFLDFAGSIKTSYTGMLFYGKYYF